MRSDRLVATLLILQRRGRVTARELASELEISEKTARRDLEALLVAGLPLYSQPGRGGGWQLLGEGRTDLSGLTADEARALFLVASATTSGAALPVDTAGALRKLAEALPESFRADAELAAKAVVVDPVAWGGRPMTAPPVHLAALQRAVLDRRRVVLSYVDRTRTSSERDVDPLGLVSKGVVWYLIADTDRGRRTFRVGRVRDVRPTTVTFERPDDFDLAEAWRTVSATIGELRAGYRATVRVGVRHVGALRAQFGEDMFMADETVGDDGRVSIMVGGPSPWVIANTLAGWGGLVEVVEPEAVRVQLAALGRELVELYEPTPGHRP